MSPARTFPIWQLMKTLRQNAVRVIDLFRLWDTDEDGTISRKEFSKGMAVLLGKNGSTSEDYDVLFDELDKNKDGELEFKELNQVRCGAPWTS